MVFGANTFGQFAQMRPAIADDQRDPWMDRMLSCPATVVSSTLPGPFAWPDFDLDPLETCTLDGRTQELVYGPTLRTCRAG